MRNTFLPVMLLVGMIMLTGCESKSGPTEKNSDKATSIDSPKISLGNECLRRLEELGAKLTRHSNGTIKSIDLVGIKVDDKTLDGLGELKTLESLVVASIDRPNPNVTDASIAQLSGIGTLKTLDLCGTAVTAKLLARLNDMRSLSQLKMSGELGHDGFEALTHFPALTSLALDVSDVSDSDLKTIAQAKKLSKLLLSKTAITDEGVSSLAGLANLECCRLSNTAITDESVVTLAKLKGLTDIDLSNTAVGDASLQVIGTMEQVKRLNFYTTKITDAGLDSLLKLENLIWLNLDNCDISDDGASKLGPLTNLVFLHLGRTKITDMSLETLASLSKLKDLHVTRTAVTQAGVEKLQKNLPDCRVIAD